ncbi:glycosyltransferase [Patescibacteria group bacterium]|nr:glycosyltransferase [Patescibacteria group bacterium]
MQSETQKITLVLPVYNEQNILEKNVNKILDFLQSKNLYWQVVIADNASTDKTTDIGKKLQDQYDNLSYFRIEHKGRGNAIKNSWQRYQSDIYIYMDIDLSTGLSSLIDLVDKINNGYDMVIGSRYLENSITQRKILRKYISRLYIVLVHIMFKTKILDFQCGFKAINKNVANNLLPQIKDKEWFFDTELLLKAEKKNFRIKEIPVKWIEGKTSKVNLVVTSLNYLIKLIKLKRIL